MENRIGIPTMNLNRSVADREFTSEESRCIIQLKSLSKELIEHEQRWIDILYRTPKPKIPPIKLRLLKTRE